MLRRHRLMLLALFLVKNRQREGWQGVLLRLGEVMKIKSGFLGFYWFRARLVNGG
ncbi:hypothetical protein ACK3YC_17845 [Aeromonas caviae]|uniref:hypothetical protein n=1 Tax=Aeromonas caviae TaxID=648 RepID=UPI00192028BB|nr:hypothetical protein [Aeromonas caviae]MBL0554826.1 hypothetical protein [Aeromonas caviae]